MNKKVIVILAGVIMFASLAETAVSKTLSRDKVPTKLKWKLEDIYSSDNQWEKEYNKTAKDLQKIEKYKGILAKSAKNLEQCLQFDSDISKEISRLGSYASMKADQDVSNPTYLAMQKKASNLAVEYSTLSSFVNPEVTEINSSTIDKFLKDNKKLNNFKFYLEQIQRTKAHRLSQPEEKILADTGSFAGAAGDIYSVFSNAEMPWAKVTLDGQEITLTKAAYGLHRADKNIKNREKVFKAFFGKLDEFRETFGVQLYENLKKDWFYAKTRKYESSLHSALDRNNIPVEVYHSLIKNVHNNLDTLHRYLEIKKRMLKLNELKYSDLYVSAVEKVDLDYTPQEAEQMILEACEPLGADYIKILKEAFDGRWVDYYPTPGKKSGAYSNGSVYDVHPYILLNYNGKYDDVSTLAHELGHSLHSYHSNKNQTYENCHYSIFVAEVASTFNEALLINKVLDEVKDDKTRLALLMNYLEGARTTLFRQTLFAEFELKVHEMVEAKVPLTGEAMSKIYGDLLKKYYGDEEGICKIDDLYSIEWAYVPHFYYNYYMYQYSTSFCASQALSQMVLAGRPGAVEKYLNLLKSGGSKYPIEQLADAGVDMTGDEPFELTIKTMNDVMDKIEEILNKSK